ncbi:MAG: hypothetical protein MMC33_008652 [Icmadophila ericetorum]|nr:hypothetical protein [Icmadophila ericetorum]
MGKKSKVLSQEEIWDDSALLESWDEALQEYKLYHSIHARGERVEDVLRVAEMEEGPYGSRAPEADKKIHRDNGMNETEMEDGELEEEDDSPIQNNGHASANSPVQSAEVKEPQDLQQPLQTNNGPAPQKALDGSHVTQTTISASTQDEALKHLMMSWYWAGYYTGLYEGQHGQGKQMSNEDVNGDTEGG